MQYPESMFARAMFFVLIFAVCVAEIRADEPSFAPPAVAIKDATIRVSPDREPFKGMCSFATG